MAFSHYSAVLGGQENIAGDNRNPEDHTIGQDATVSGGYNNYARGEHSSILGGNYNPANSEYDTNVGDRTRVYLNAELLH